MPARREIHLQEEQTRNRQIERIREQGIASVQLLRNALDLEAGKSASDLVQEEQRPGDSPGRRMGEQKDRAVVFGRAREIRNAEVDEELSVLLQRMEVFQRRKVAPPRFVPKLPVPLWERIEEVKRINAQAEEILKRLIVNICTEFVGVSKKVDISLGQEEIERYNLITGVRRNSNEVAVAKFNVELSYQVISVLKTGTWLNDEVINFFFNLLEERNNRIRSEGNRKIPKCGFMNSFFYTKLADGGNYNYKNVKRWTKKKKLDIFDLDLFLFPVNLNNTHWCIGVLDFRNRQIQYYDSLGGSGGYFFDIMKRYLEDEHLDKKGSSLDISSWKGVNVAGIPRQKNGYDCGMFLCKFADFLSEGLPLEFSQNDIVYFRQRMLNEILLSHVV